MKSIDEKWCESVLDQAKREGLKRREAVSTPEKLARWLGSQGRLARTEVRISYAGGVLVEVALRLDGIY